MNTPITRSTLELLALGVWFTVPALLISRCYRFRVLVGTISFWLLGALYYLFVSPPRSPFAPGSEWLIFGWISSFLYATLIARVQTKLRRAETLAATNPTTNPNDNSRNA